MEPGKEGWGVNKGNVCTRLETRDDRPVICDGDPGKRSVCVKGLVK